MCTKKIIYRPLRNTNPVPPGSESTTLPMSYPGIYIPLSGPLGGPAGTLPMPWWCPPDIPYTLRPLVGSPLGIPTGTGRAFDSRPGTRQDSGRVSVKHDLIMTTVPGARHSHYQGCFSIVFTGHSLK